MKFHFGSQVGLAGSKPGVPLRQGERPVPRDRAASFDLGLLKRFGSKTLHRIAIQIFDSHVIPP